MNKDLLDKARADMIAEFGELRGSRMASVILPNVMADFFKMLDKAAPETEVVEEYQIENSKSLLHVAGHSKVVNGKKEFVITSIDLKRI